MLLGRLEIKVEDRNQIPISPVNKSPVKMNKKPICNTQNPKPPGEDLQERARGTGCGKERGALAADSDFLTRNPSREIKASTDESGSPQTKFSAQRKSLQNEETDCIMEKESTE